jgi:hypothetical protein
VGQAEGFEWRYLREGQIRKDESIRAGRKVVSELRQGFDSIDFCCEAILAKLLLDAL